MGKPDSLFSSPRFDILLKIGFILFLVLGSHEQSPVHLLLFFSCTEDEQTLMEDTDPEEDRKPLSSLDLISLFISFALHDLPISKIS